VDLVVETVGGTADTLETAVTLCRPGGTICVLGAFTKPLTFPALFVLAKELRLQGSMVYNRGGTRADFELVQDILARDGTPLRPPPLPARRHRAGVPPRRRQDDRLDQGHDHRVTMLSIQRLTHVGICVSDLERSLRFYRDLLGFSPEHELAVDGEPTDTLLR